MRFPAPAAVVSRDPGAAAAAGQTTKLAFESTRIELRAGGGREPIGVEPARRIEGNVEAGPARRG